MAKLGCRAMGLVVLGAIGAIGCGPETSTSSSGGAGGTSTSTGPVCPDDPATGDVPEECGIWVSLTMGDDANTGTQIAPVASLAHAIELADKGLRRVYACGETWSETLTIPSGVSLHGGFDCQAGWKYVGEDKRAALVSPSQVAITWVQGAGTEDAFLTEFGVESADAVEPSSSSIAVFVRDAMTVHFRGCDLVAGDGADGEDGEDGDPNGLPGAAGTAGNIGADACSGMASQGGPQAVRACPSSSSHGGAGGNSTVALAADGQPGEPASDPPAGGGGLGEQSSPVCTAGNTGANGANGPWGYGAGRTPGDLLQGHMTKDGYSGQPGHDGVDAEPGQGGGGGGATFGSSAVCGAAMSAGAAGGSGGSGGCGGKGGRGGQAGGASIGIAAVSGGVFTEGVSFTMGRGGNGGNGGKPQGGGAGAPGGMGGKGAGSIAAGCAGGSGGNGGKGGWGGGGFGGAVAAFGVQIDSVLVGIGAGDTFHLGTPGTGGLGDPSQGATSNGKDGDAVIDPQFNP